MRIKQFEYCKAVFHLLRKTLEYRETGILYFSFLLEALNYREAISPHYEREKGSPPSC